MLNEIERSLILGLSDVNLMDYVRAGPSVHDRESLACAAGELKRRNITLPRSVAAPSGALPPTTTPGTTEGDARLPAQGQILCQGCGIEAPNKYVTYHQNIGAVVLRFTQTYKGYMCHQCNRKYFWQTTLTTMAVGWWGVISFFVTIGNLAHNISEYRGARTIPPVPDGARKPVLTEAVIDKIAPYVPEITERMQARHDLAMIARHVGPRAGVTPGEA